MKKFLYSIWEVVEVALIAGIAVFVIRNFLIQPFLVSGASMEPSFSSGDYLLINEISYQFHKPGRGEVIVFHYPGNRSTYYIKRIIGLPGEKIVVQDGKVFIFSKDNPDGFELKENYLSIGALTLVSEQNVFNLGENEYFVMGDNRGYSFDSRNWGNLKESDIVGSVQLRLWPFNRVMAFEKPAY